MIPFKTYSGWKRVQLLPLGGAFHEDTEHNLTEGANDPAYDDIHHPKHGMFNTRLNPETRKAVKAYCKTASTSKYGDESAGNINSYLRHRAGDKHSIIMGRHFPEHVHAATKRFSKVFTKDNTNKHHIVTHAGVHPKAGAQYAKMEPGHKSSLAGFQSSSTEHSIAKGFARQHLNQPGAGVVEEHKHLHVLVLHHEPHSCISVANHSHYDHERECVTHHGAHCEYMHSETKPPEGMKDKEKGVKSVTFHHIKVHSHLEHHTKLEDYPHPYVDRVYTHRGEDGVGKHVAYDGEKTFHVDADSNGMKTK